MPYFRKKKKSVMLMHWSEQCLQGCTRHCILKNVTVLQCSLLTCWGKIHQQESLGKNQAWWIYAVTNYTVFLLWTPRPLEHGHCLWAGCSMSQPITVLYVSVIVFRTGGLFTLFPFSFWIFITMPLVHCSENEWSVLHIDLRELSKIFL